MLALAETRPPYKEAYGVGNIERIRQTTEERITTPRQSGTGIMKVPLKAAPHEIQEKSGSKGSQKWASGMHSTRNLWQAESRMKGENLCIMERALEQVMKECLSTSR